MKNKHILILSALMVFIVLIFTAYYLGSQRHRATFQGAQIQNQTFTASDLQGKVMTEEEIRVIQESLVPSFGEAQPVDKNIGKPITEEMAESLAPAPTTTDAPVLTEDDIKKIQEALAPKPR